MSRKVIARRDFVKISIAAMGVFAVGGMLSACSSNDGGSEQAGATSAGEQQVQDSGAASNAASSSKVLVAYYSAQGHTRAVAQAVADELGADIFEIVPQQVYSEDDLDWNNSESRVSREHDDESLRDVPLAQSTPNNWADYDTVLVGYPIWWAIAAWPCNHFASDNDFTGKKVIPFCTSSSSEIGQSGELLAQAAGTGDWLDGQRFSSDASDSEVRSWAAGI